jgi:light-harvesting protein B-800-850 alpha chain
MWLVVSPTIGLPLFLGGVAVTSLLIHTAVLTHSTWYPAYLQGNQHVKTVSSIATPAPTKLAAQ